MAFKMTKPVIKGSVQHKKSIARLSTTEVEMTRTKADAGLVYAGEELGKSIVPHAIDYSIDVSMDPLLGSGEERDKRTFGDVKPEKVIKVKKKEIKQIKSDEPDFKIQKSIGTGPGSKPWESGEGEKKKKKTPGSFISLEDIKKSNEEARKEGIVKASQEGAKDIIKEKKKEGEKKEGEKKVKVGLTKKSKKKKKVKKKKKKRGSGKFGKWLKKVFSKKKK